MRVRVPFGLPLLKDSTMADMDSVLLFDTLTDDPDNGERIFATLGPQGHLCSKEELLAMCRAAIADVRAGNGRDIDLTR